MKHNSRSHVFNLSNFKLFNYRFMIITILFTLIFFLIYIIYIRLTSSYVIQNNEVIIEETHMLNKLIDNEIAIEENSNTNAINGNVIIEIARTSLQLRLDEYRKENEDVKGWIKIDGTNIDYPVLQGNDNSYYLTHNYKKEENKNGSIFFNSMTNLNRPSLNFIIYGHNLRNKSMFTALVNYRNTSFYENHKTIRLATISDDNVYEIISVFETTVDSNNNIADFEYFNYSELGNKKTYNEYVNKVKELSIYDIPVIPEYPEQLITLITCNYFNKNGRTLIIAKRTSNITTTAIP